MLASCVIFLQVKQEVLVPPALGQVLHAFFLDKVRDLDPALADELHKPASLKPFTISPLWGKTAFEENRWRLFPGEEYSFRVTSLSSALSLWMQNIWAPALPYDINLAGTEMRVCGFTFDQKRHPWADSSSFTDIYDYYVSEENIRNKLSLQFYSPTTFRSQGMNYPLPDPHKVFANLLQKWNYYSPVHLGDNFLCFIAENLFPSDCRIITKIMHFSHYKQVGFVGQCGYGIKHHNEDIMARAAHMLAEFAFYAGIGYKTTMGMGQSRLLIR